LTLCFLSCAFHATNALATTITAWTTIDYPGADATEALGISGSKIVGWYNIGGNNHGFVYNNSAWTSFDDPSAPTTVGDSSGTFFTGVSGTNVVGYNYAPLTSPNYFAFLFDGTSWTSLVPPNGHGATYAMGISGNNVVGYSPAGGFLYNIGTKTYTRL